MVKVSAPGKCHLIGEHAVVYGEPAIIAAIGKRTYVEAEKRDDDKIMVEWKTHETIEFTVQEALETAERLDRSWANNAEKKDFSECHSLFVDNVTKAVISKCIQMLDVNSGMDIVIRTNIPLGSGLGSSAAYAVAMAKAVAEVNSIELSRERNNEIAYEIEKYAHGNPSGGDNSTCCFGGLIWFKKNMEGGPHTIKPLSDEIPKLENFVLTYTIKPIKTTSQLVQQVMNMDPAVRDPKVKAIGRDVKEMLDVLKARNFERMKELINRTQDNLTGIGVSVPEIDRVVEKVRSIGGAAKGCGALGGGIVLCYHEDEGKLIQALKEIGQEPIKADLAVEGVRTE